MSIINAIILGVLQGLTEFLPVSSSGHLTVAQYFLALKEHVIFTNVCLHMGTLCALIFYLREDILKALKDKKQLLAIIFASVTTAILALIFKELLEGFFEKTSLIFVMLIINGVILLCTKNKKTCARPIGIREALAIGVIQAMAIIPGISRSGITIAVMIFLGIERREAFRFSFLVAIPVIFGAFLLKTKDVLSVDAMMPLAPLLIGFTFSFFSGLLALNWLKKVLDHSKLYLFGIYCLVAGFIFVICF